MATFWLEHAGSRTLIRSGQNSIGRSPYCRFVIDDPRVSREHAVLEVEEGRLFLHDLGSANGTTVNGERVDGRVELRDGAAIKVGRVELRVLRVSTRSGLEKTRARSSRPAGPAPAEPADRDARAADRVAAKVRALHRACSFDLAVQIGRVVVDELYGGLAGWRRAGDGGARLAPLESRTDLPVSFATVRHHVLAYDLLDQLGGPSAVEHLTLEHVVEVFRLPAEERRSLLDRAESESWSVERIREACSAIEGAADGRPPR